MVQKIRSIRQEISKEMAENVDIGDEAELSLNGQTLQDFRVDNVNIYKNADRQYGVAKLVNDEVIEDE